MSERLKLLLAVLLGLILAVGGLVAYTVHRTHRAHADHVRDNPERRLARIADGAAVYYEAERATPSGDLLPRQFPRSAPLTPAESPCAAGEVRVAPDAARWAHPTWQALHFAIDEPHPYRYAFIAGPTGYTARALGDLDCDGVLSTFERIGTVGPEGVVRTQSFRQNELE